MNPESVVVLASQSQVRFDLMVKAGIPVQRQAAAVDEDAIKRSCRAEGMAPEDVAIILAETKALRVSEQYPESVTLGADQMLVCEGKWFNKPQTKQEAREQLQHLRGKTHRLITAVVAVRNGQRFWQHLEKPELTMRPYSEAFLDEYLDGVGEAWKVSVGAYQIEGYGAQCMGSVRGDYFAILGLPLLPVMEMLRAQGILKS